MAQLKYPIGIQSFPEIRTKGYLYVDKTEFIHTLVSKGKYYFLSRPRRFGKSLLLSTLKAFFEGRRDLFEGLAICSHEDIVWDSHPVILIDLNAKNYTSRQSLEERISTQLSEYENIYGKRFTDSSIEGRFLALIKQAHEKTGCQVAVLIDEYDKPVLDSFHDNDTSSTYREVLRGFYSVLKSVDDEICFALLTGITKFGHLNVFSGLNNLNDISLDNAYASICGITETELTRTFSEGLHRLADNMQKPYAETVGLLKKNYDGYHFAEKSPDIYNPFSILCCLDKEAIKPFWFLTGTPSFLIDLLRKRHYDLSQIDGAEYVGSKLYGVDIAASDPIPVLYQSGYLTIKGYDPRFDSYMIGFPNLEVREGFLSSLLPFYTGLTNDDRPFNLMNFVKEIEKGQPEQFMTRLQSMFASIPYEMEMENERNFQNVMYMIFTLMGVYTNVEYHTSNGRIDVIVMTAAFIYIIEIKIDSTPEVAISQIDDKGYATPFKSDSRTVYKIGANFSTETRTLTGWIIEKQ